MVIDASSYTRIATLMPSELSLSTPQNSVLPPEVMIVLLKSGEQMLLVLRHPSTLVSLGLPLVFTLCQCTALARLPK
jgi:hypothetical protein